MELIKKVKNLFAKKYKISNRKVTKARFLYYYFIFAPILGLVYFIASIWTEILPWHYCFSPFYLLAFYVLGRFLIKNRNLIWMYITDMERGRLLLYINKNTHWSEAHKSRVVKWVYLSKKTIRQETKAEIANKIINKEVLNKEEAIKAKYKSVSCPQQLKGDQAGWNEAMLVDALIYAHRYIQVLDEEIRGIMNLTNENIAAFNIQNEYKKCTDPKYAKSVKIKYNNVKK